MADRLLVIGVGNRDRGDDAVGPVVCDLLDDASDSTARTVVLEGNVLDLPMRWEATDRVVIVDAAAPAGHPGRVSVVDAVAERLSAPSAVSTHGVDVAAAIELARTIGKMPAELVVIGIEAATDRHGAALTEEVARSARCVAGRLAADRPFA